MKIRQQRTIEKNICKKMILLSFCMILMVSMAGCGNKRKENLTITNVSYDPTREFYEKYNKDFIKYYKDKYGKKVEVIQSHGGSGSQARSVVEGSNGDVVTLALEHDISLIEQTGLINKGWQKRFSNDSAPYHVKHRQYHKNRHAAQYPDFQQPLPLYNQYNYDSTEVQISR